MKLYDMPRRSGKTTKAVEWVKAGRLEVKPNASGKLLTPELLPESYHEALIKNNRAIVVLNVGIKKLLRREHGLLVHEVFVFEELKQQNIGKQRELWLDEGLLMLRGIMRPHHISTMTFTCEE